MKRTLQILRSAAVLIVIGVAALRAQQQEEPTPRIQVTGTATINLVPDELAMQIRIVNENADAEKAVDAYRKTREDVLAALRKYKVGDTNIIERGLSFTRQIERNYETGKIIRQYYRASTTIDVVLRNFDVYPDLVVELTGMPGVELGSVSYSSSREIQTRGQARIQAMEAAQEKARAMAAVVGATLGKPLLITENVYTPYTPVQVSNRLYAGDGEGYADAASPLVVSDDAIQVVASVYVEFELR